MLQSLKAGQWCAKLLAGAQVVDRGLKQRRHDSEHFGARRQPDGIDNGGEIIESSRQSCLGNGALKGDRTRERTVYEAEIAPLDAGRVGRDQMEFHTRGIGIVAMPPG